MNFIKTRLPNGSETYINMDVVFTIRKGAGFVTVTTAAGEEIRIAGEESARFLRQIERPGPTNRRGRTGRDARATPPEKNPPDLADAGLTRFGK
jgi:hypothetical protein